MLPALPHPCWQQLKQGLLQSIPGRTSSQDCTLQTQLLNWCLLWLRPLLPVLGKGHRQGCSLGPTTSLAPETRSRMSWSKCRPRSAAWGACQGSFVWQSCLLPAGLWCVHLSHLVAQQRSSSKTKMLYSKIQHQLAFKSSQAFLLLMRHGSYALLLLLVPGLCMHKQPVSYALAYLC